MDGPLGDMATWLFGEKGQGLVAGALGGVVRWLTLRERPRDGAVSIVIGAICAMYLTPVAFPMIDPLLSNVVVDSEARTRLASFIIGVGGIGIVSFVVDLWKVRRKTNGTDPPKPPAGGTHG